MPVIIGNGRDVVRINGRIENYQGIGHIRRDVSTDVAVAKIKNDGLDEYFINVRDDQGKTQRVVVYGDQLDFSWRKAGKMPTVTINGREATLVAFDKEQTSFGRGAIEGIKSSLGDAFQSLSDLAKTTLGKVVEGGAATIVGGTALLAFAKPLGLLGTGLGATLGTIATPIAWGALVVGGLALLAIIVSGAFKGASAAMVNHPKLEAITEITGEANDLDSQQPYSPPGSSIANQRPTPPAPFTPQPPVVAPLTPVPPAAPSMPVLQPVRPPLKAPSNPSFTLHRFS